MNLTLSLGKRLFLFACIFLVCFLVVQLFAGFVMQKWGIDSTPAMRIVAVVQDVVMFILPALVTAMMITRVPATFLTIDRKPPIPFTIIAVCGLIVSVPFMNFVIYANQSIQLPASMSGLEQVLRQMEAQASSLVTVLQGAPTVANLIMSILIVGLFAGLGEEIFFRGAFQRILTTGRVNPYMSIWIVAFFFSLLHMQFYGFIPRMLLGAYFGYLMYWTRCVWVPVIVHAVNNSIVVWSQWHSTVNGTVNVAETVGYDGNTLVVLGSAAFTTVCIMLLRTQRIQLKEV